MRERADRECVEDSADADGAPEEPTGREHRQLEPGAHDADRMASRREPGHQAVPRAWPEPSADVRARRDAVEEDAAHEDRPRPDRERRVPREPLVEDVPRIEPQAGEHEQRGAEAVEDEATVELCDAYAQ